MALWQKWLLQMTFQQMICLWKRRNDEHHDGCDGETREENPPEHEVLLLNKIRVIYTNRGGYPPRVQHLWRDSSEIHCTAHCQTPRLDWCIPCNFWSNARHTLASA
jgi:hypothetical protein